MWQSIAASHSDDAFSTFRSREGTRAQRAVVVEGFHISVSGFESQRRRWPTGHGPFSAVASQ